MVVCSGTHRKKGCLCHFLRGDVEKGSGTTEVKACGRSLDMRLVGSKLIPQ